MSGIELSKDGKDIHDAQTMPEKRMKDMGEAICEPKKVTEFGR